MGDGSEASYYLSSIKMGNTLCCIDKKLYTAQQLHAGCFSMLIYTVARRSSTTSIVINSDVTE